MFSLLILQRPQSTLPEREPLFFGVVVCLNFSSRRFMSSTLPSGERYSSGFHVHGKECEKSILCCSHFQGIENNESSQLVSRIHAAVGTNCPIHNSSILLLGATVQFVRLESGLNES